jgi:hypothetical protein
MVVEAGDAQWAIQTRLPGKAFLNDSIQGGGRRRTRRGIGPLRKGELTKYGYHATVSMRDRRKDLTQAVRKYGALSTFRKLNAAAVYSKHYPTTARTFRRDRNWVRKTFLSRKSK